MWDSTEDFALGAASATSVTQFRGDVTLGHQAGSSVETTKDQFLEGRQPEDELSRTAVSETDDGEIVINQGYTYTTATTPAIGGNYVYSAFLDDARNLLYVNTSGGLSVINTQGTVSAADDTLVTTYTTATTPAIGSHYIYSAFLDDARNLLYVSTYDGLSVINTQGTVSAADDTLVKTYTTATTPALSSESASFLGGSFIDASTNLLYVGTAGNGLSVVNLDEQYNAQGSYVSRAADIDTLPAKALSWDETKTSGQSVSLQYRTGGSDAVWRDEFDDGDTGNVSDRYAWGSPFNTKSEADGVLTMSDPQASSWAAMWIDTGKPAGYFPAGSIIKAKIRVNTDALEYYDALFEDEWDGNGFSEFYVQNEWSYHSFVASTPFSIVGIEPAWKAGTWQPGDTYQIDWIQIETPASFGQWNDWSAACTDHTSCPIDQAGLTGNAWIQYKLNLATADTGTTPSVHSVTYSDGYQSTGTYTSQDLSFPDTNELLTFVADDTTPDGTSIAYEYSIDQGTTWNALSRNDTFPSSFKAKYFRWRATLSTTNELVTPVIHSVTLTATESDLTRFSAKTRQTQVEGELLDYGSVTYVRDCTPDFQGTNTQARNGQAALYRKRKQGGKQNLASSSVSANGDWKLSSDKQKQDTEATYFLRFTDQAGNQSSLSKPIKIFCDKTLPLFQSFPALKTYQRGDRLDFAAKDEQSGLDHYEVRIESLFKKRDYRIQQEAFYILPDSLSPGPYTLSVKAVDKAGNRARKSILVTVTDRPVQAVAPEQASPDTGETKTGETPAAAPPKDTATTTPQAPAVAPAAPERTAPAAPAPPAPIQAAPAEPRKTFRWWNPFTWF